jgi:non-canonical purine NTP pyrophosphatase (RdgB/HAM1 family)
MLSKSQKISDDADQGSGLKLMIGTSNSGKYGEIIEILGDLPFRFFLPFELGLKGDVEENGLTYEENASIKARHFYRQCGFLTLAEDSGIVVDALAGELGVKTRRWGAGTNATDEEWIKYFMKVMEKVPSNKRTARFVCCAAVAVGQARQSGQVGMRRKYDQGAGLGAGCLMESANAKENIAENLIEVHLFRGETEGVITKDLEAPIIPGIPLSSCFRPVGFSKVYAALATEAKNAISHRGKAIKAVKDYLAKLINAKVNYRSGNKC